MLRPSASSALSPNQPSTTPVVASISANAVLFFHLRPPSFAFAHLHLLHHNIASTPIVCLHHGYYQVLNNPLRFSGPQSLARALPARRLLQSPHGPSFRHARNNQATPRQPFVCLIPVSVLLVTHTATPSPPPSHQSSPSPSSLPVDCPSPPNLPIAAARLRLTLPPKFLDTKHEHPFSGASLLTETTYPHRTTTATRPTLHNPSIQRPADTTSARASPLNYLHPFADRAGCISQVQSGLGPSSLLPLCKQFSPSA